MIRGTFQPLFVIGLFLWIPVARGDGRAERPETTETPQQEASAAPEPSDGKAPPQRTRKYLDLRYNEDFSFLDGEPGSYQPDPFDAIKNIHLADHWRLTLGGEFRYRLEAETNKTFGAAEPAQDTFHLFRYQVHLDLKYRDRFRAFAQMMSALDEGRDLPRRGIDENKWDLQQLFFDLRLSEGASPWIVRVGRQDLLYGNQRLVSPFDWANVRRRFDGVKLFTSGEQWDVDLWYVKPVPVQRKQRDRFDEEVDFYGLYTTYKALPRHGLDLYFFAITDDGNRINPNGRRGDRSVYTVGSRFWGDTGSFDYEAELAGQWGHWAGDRVKAWSWTLDGGYTFVATPWSPRLGAGFDWASGDGNPRDGKVGTFDQLFPLGHKYFGYLDLIGRQNITAVNVNLSAWPVPKTVKTAMAFHTFWLNDNKDALYNAGGRAGRRDPFGNSGTEVGHELDLTLVWKLNAHAGLLFGYSHFWESDFIRQTGVSEDADLFYVQYAFKF